MGQESEALKADIEQRRESMTGTIDAIEDRVVPSRIIERRRAAVSGWAGGHEGACHGISTFRRPTRRRRLPSKVSDGVSHATDAVATRPRRCSERRRVRR